MDPSVWNAAQAYDSARPALRRLRFEVPVDKGGRPARRGRSPESRGEVTVCPSDQSRPARAASARRLGNNRISSAVQVSSRSTPRRPVAAATDGFAVSSSPSTTGWNGIELTVSISDGSTACWASSSTSAGSARSRSTARGPAATPSSSSSAEVAAAAWSGRSVWSTPALWQTIRRNRPVECDDPNRCRSEPAPADSPNTVTRSGCRRTRRHGAEPSPWPTAGRADRHWAPSPRS